MNQQSNQLSGTVSNVGQSLLRSTLPDRQGGGSSNLSQQIMMTPSSSGHQVSFFLSY